jgi:hypothetical protein
VTSDKFGTLSLRVYFGSRFIGIASLLFHSPAQGFFRGNALLGGELAHVFGDLDELRQPAKLT